MLKENGGRSLRSRDRISYVVLRNQYARRRVVWACKRERSYRKKPPEDQKIMAVKAKV